MMRHRLAPASATRSKNEPQSRLLRLFSLIRQLGLRWPSLPRKYIGPAHGTRADGQRHALECGEFARGG